MAIFVKNHIWGEFEKIEDLCDFHSKLKILNFFGPTTIGGENYSERAFQNCINVRTSNLTATVPDVEVRSLLEADADAMIFQQE